MAVRLDGQGPAVDCVMLCILFLIYWDNLTHLRQHADDFMIASGIVDAEIIEPLFYGQFTGFMGNGSLAMGDVAMETQLSYKRSS